jgi:hypothetical protein
MAEKSVRALFRVLQALYVLGQGTPLPLIVYDQVLKIVRQQPKFTANAIDLAESLALLIVDTNLHQGRSFLHQMLVDLIAQLMRKSNADLLQHLPEVSLVLTDVFWVGTKLYG